jgi:hypothetical protein
MTALESLSARLDVSPGSLQQTLMQTAFKGCSQAEFIALVIVSNTYNLNPLLRELYAFPKKGGGIQAIVGYDGWIKIANAHPQYDGFEAEHIEDANGDLKAIEGILHRKDRSHPTKSWSTSRNSSEIPIRGTTLRTTCWTCAASARPCVSVWASAGRRGDRRYQRGRYHDGA